MNLVYPNLVDTSQVTRIFNAGLVDTSLLTQIQFQK